MSSQRKTIKIGEIEITQDEGTDLNLSTNRPGEIANENDEFNNLEKNITTRPASGDAYFACLMPVEEDDLSHATREECKQKINQVIIALRNREFFENKYFLRQSIFFLPVPIFDVKTKTVNIKIHSFDLKETDHPLDHIINDLLQIQYFRDEKEENLNRVEALNIIRTITEFLDNFIYGPQKTAFSKTPDYGMTVRLLTKLPFKPAKLPSGYNCSHKISPKETVEVNASVVEDFKLHLLNYFGVKDEEVKKNVTEIELSVHKKVSNRMFPVAQMKSGGDTEVDASVNDNDVRNISGERMLILQKTEKILNNLKELEKEFKNIVMDQSELCLFRDYIINPQNFLAKVMILQLLTGWEEKIHTNNALAKLNKLRDMISGKGFSTKLMGYLLIAVFRNPDGELSDNLKVQLEFEVGKI